MANLSDLLSMDNLVKLFDLVAENRVSVTLSVVGVLLVAIAGLLAYKAIKLKPEQTSASLKTLLFTALIGGVLCSLGGPGLSLLEVSRDRDRGFRSTRISSHEALSRLEKNSKVDWLIRLITYNPETQPELSLARLTHLGRASQRYTFVAAYDELRGYTAEEAVYKVGGSFAGQTNRVSAILFPLAGRQLYPANARGLLQIVKKIDDDRDPAAEGYRSLDIASQLTPDQLKGLNDVKNIGSWSWKGYGIFYSRYCQLAQSFRCSQPPYAAMDLIGDLSRDWHPLGLSRRLIAESNECGDAETNNQCNITKWEDTQELQETFGARVFFIENVALSELSGRILIDFTQPNSQVIPDLGLLDAR